MRKLFVLGLIVLGLYGCEPREIPDNQRQLVECAFARLNCDPSWNRQ